MQSEAYTLVAMTTAASALLSCLSEQQQVALCYSFDAQVRGGVDTSNDFWVALFGTPDTSAWAWRCEGHHLSVTMTVVDDQVSPLRASSVPTRPGSDLATAELVRLDPAELHFSWEGPLEPGRGHYYRIQAPSLLIEYDNTANQANHVHTVLRSPGEDFGESLLTRHYSVEHSSPR